MLKLFLISISLLLVTPYPFAIENHIINLGKPTFETAKNEFQESLLVYFYEARCLPCRKFWPELLQAAETCANAQSKVQFAKVECYDEVELCNNLGVKSFPTLKLFNQVKGSTYEYRGPRTAIALSTWARAIFDNVYYPVDEEEDLFRHHGLAILTESGTPGIIAAYQDLIDEIVVAVPGPKLKEKIKASNAIMTQGGEIVPLENEKNPDEIKRSIHDLFYWSKKAVPNFSWHFNAKLEGEKDIDFVLFFRTNKFSALSEAAKAFDAASKEWASDGLIFAYVNVADDLIGEQLSKYFGVKADDEPSVGVISKKGKVLQKYKLNGAVNFDDIKQLIFDIEEGKGVRYYMSAEIPTNDVDYIKELVGKNYAQVTEDPNLNVLVMFYYPWCIDSIMLEPTWKALAYRLRFTKDVVIARVNVWDNDIESIQVAQYPTVFFYGKGEKKPIQYTGENTIKEVKKFLFEKIPNLKEEIEL